MRQMNKVPMIDGKMTAKSLEGSDKLIFERQIGHKADIPGSG